MTSRGKRSPPPPLVLTNPTSARAKCPACGREVKDMSRHAGSAVCVNAARLALINRLGLVEVWFREKNVLGDGEIPVTVIRERKDGKDKRRWYAPPEPVAAMRVLDEAGVKEKQIARLLRGPKDELERELAVAGLRGPMDASGPDADGFTRLARPIMRPIRQSVRAP